MYLPRNIWFVLVVIMISSCSTETLDVTSPTGKLGVTVEPMEGKAYDKITFSVNYDGKTILSQTELGLETDVQKFYGNLKLILLQTKNMSMMNIRHIIFRKEPKDGCSNTTPDTKSFFRYQQMENSPAVPKLTLGDIPDS